MDGVGEHHPKRGNPVSKDHSWYALTDKWILAQKLRIPKTQFTYQMMSKKEEGEGPGPGNMTINCLS